MKTKTDKFCILVTIVLFATIVVSVTQTHSHMTELTSDQPTGICYSQADQYAYAIYPTTMILHSKVISAEDRPYEAPTGTYCDTVESRK